MFVRNYTYTILYRYVYGSFWPQSPYYLDSKPEPRLLRYNYPRKHVNPEPEDEAGVKT